MASDWNNWQWIGGYGGGYSFHYKESDMNNVPKWVRDALIKLLNEGYDPEGDAQSNGCVELTGKKYRYRIIPVMVEQGNARIDIRRRKKTGKGVWRTWDWDQSLRGVQRKWKRENWEEIGQITWPKSGIKSVIMRLSGNRSSTQTVPTWVQDEFIRRLDEEEFPIYDITDHSFYQLTGKKYLYRILPTTIQERKVEADVFRPQRKL